MYRCTARNSQHPVRSLGHSIRRRSLLLVFKVVVGLNYHVRGVFIHHFINDIVVDCPGLVSVNNAKGQ